MTTSVAAMVTRIRNGARPHPYMTEWREHMGLSVETVANRMGRDRTTIWRWEAGKRRPKPADLAAFANALNVEPGDLWRLPSGRPSVDAILKNATDDVAEAVADLARRLTKRAS